MESPSAGKRKRQQILAEFCKRRKIEIMPLNNLSPNDQIVPIIEAEAANTSALGFLGLETVSDIFADSTPPDIDLSAEKTSTGKKINSEQLKVKNIYYSSFLFRF